MRSLVERWRLRALQDDSKRPASPNGRLQTPEAIQRASTLPIGAIVVPFGGSYLGSYKIIPKKELLWSLWLKLYESAT